MDKETKLSCDEIMVEIRKFSPAILYIGNKIKDSRLEKFEAKFSLSLTNEFKYILKNMNGFSIASVSVIGIDDSFKDNSLDKIYEFEHFKAKNSMPSYFVPFSADGRGNHYCLDLSRSKTDSCPIVFWQWDFEYQSVSDVETCNNNFVEWIKEVMIEWALEDYDHQGKSKS